MAQVLKLKRTAVSGKIPSTSQLQLGELAINTYDGRIFFEKDNGTPSISEILIVNTHTPVTGSLNLNGNISATNITLSGDLVVQGTTTTIDSTNLNIGDNIIELNYGGSSTIGGIYVKDATGGSTTSGSLLWDSTNDYWKLGTSGSESQVITISNLVSNLPSGVISGSSQITITESQISDLTHTEIPSGTISGSSQLNGSTLSNMTISGSFSGSFIGDGSNLTGLTVDQVATVTDTFTNVTSKTVTHNFGTKNVIVTIYDENDSYFIPSSIVTTNDNQVTVGFSGVESGRVVVAKGGHVVSGSASDANQLNGQAGSYYLDFTNFTNIPSGLVSGSSQISFNGITDKPSLVSGSSQISYVGLSNIPSGIISGSSQVVSSLNNQNLNLGTGTISATAISGSLNIPDSSTLQVGSQIFYPQGNNGFSVNEDFDPSNSSTQTAYHYTSGTGRETVAFTLARTSHFTNGFGVYGTNTNNTFVTFGEQGNTKFEWRRSVGIRPLDLDGGTLLATLTRDGAFSTTGGITGSFQPTGHIIPDTNEAYDLGSPTNRFRDLYLSGSTLYLGDTKLSKDVDGNLEVKDSNDTLKTLKVAQIEVGSGAKKVTLKVENDRLKFEDKDSGGDINTYRTNINGLSSYTINHNLDEDYPVVQVYDSLKKQVVPQRIESITSSSLELEFSGVFTGVVVVKK